MRVRIDCTVEYAVDAHRYLGEWIAQAESGELDGEDLLDGLTGVLTDLEAQMSTLRRALSY